MILQVVLFYLLQHNISTLTVIINVEKYNLKNYVSSIYVSLSVRLCGLWCALKAAGVQHTEALLL